MRLLIVDCGLPDSSATGDLSGTQEGLLSAYWAELYIHGCAMCIMMRVMRVLACTCANGLLFSIAGFHCFEKLLS